MRIAIEARALSAKGGGVKTYTHQLIRHLLKLNDENDYLILRDSARQTDALTGARGVVVPFWHEGLLPVWLQWQVPRELKRLKPDVVHFTKADVPRRKVAPTVVTIFDIIPLLFPESQALSRRLYWPGALRRAATQSDWIVTISEASKRDIIKILGVEAERITVTPPAVDRQFFCTPAAVSPAREPYILFVGTRDKRKNVGALLRAFAAIKNDIPHRLVIAGKCALKADNAEADAQRLGLLERVEFKDYVPDDQLPALYSSADLFVWPSVYEGWGFPPQEAMACGTPVIVSNGGAIPEVVGQAGEVVAFTTDDLEKRTCDNVFEKNLAAAMGEVLGDEAKRADMRRHGLERVQQFSWDQVARDTFDVYKKAAVS